MVVDGSDRRYDNNYHSLPIPIPLVNRMMRRRRSFVGDLGDQEQQVMDFSIRKNTPYSTLVGDITLIMIIINH